MFHAGLYLFHHGLHPVLLDYDVERSRGAALDSGRFRADVAADLSGPSSAGMGEMVAIRGGADGLHIVDC